jgi:hypothetical protein
MKGLLGEGLKMGGSALNTFGGGAGKILGMGMSYLGNRLNPTDNMTGGIAQGLVGARF